MPEHISTDLFGEEELVSDGLTKTLFDEADILETAFRNFRERGFPYPSLELFEMKMQLNELANLELAKCVHSVLGYRIADTYHKHRFHSAAYAMRSPYESFMIDKSLKKVLMRQYADKKSFEYGYLGFMSLVSGTQACSNFRPAFARMLYNKYAKPGAHVFDSSTGYGGRLVGFLSSHCSRYYGTDPNTLTYAANQKLRDDLKNEKQVLLFNSPIEDLYIDEIKESCDFSFTSPPYFKKEIYSDEPTQSCNRYPEHIDWVNNFLRPMINKQFEVLKKDSICIVNIEDVNISGKRYELVKPTIEIAIERGFTHIENKIFPLQARTKMVEGVKVIVQGQETVIVLKK